MALRPAFNAADPEEELPVPEEPDDTPPPFLTTLANTGAAIQKHMVMARTQAADFLMIPDMKIPS